jgi:hypothetical protein
MMSILQNIKRGIHHVFLMLLLMRRCQNISEPTVGEYNLDRAPHLKEGWFIVYALGTDAEWEEWEQ